MNSTQEFPKLILHDGFDERDAFEIVHKGWYSAQIEFAKGDQYPINFYDPERLRQEIAENMLRNQPCFAEPNLVVIPEVTLEAMQNSIRYLFESGFFDDVLLSR